MTVEQARKLWCPEADTDVPPGKLANDFDPERDACCIADVCAHWRWAVEQVAMEDRVTAGGIPVKGDWQLVKTDKGYCGLSGRPETE